MGDVIRSVKIEVSGEDKGASATMRKVAEAEKALAAEAKASLQVQAQAGDAAAKADLQRLATAEKFAARKDVLGKIAFGQGMGPEVAPIAAQRQAAQAALEKLAAQERGVTASEATSAFGGSVNGQLASAWGAVIDNTAKQAASAQKAVAEKLKQGAEHEGGEGLAGAFLGIKHFEHLAKGAGVMLVGHLLAEATDKAREFADALREGEKSAAEMTGDFLKGLPIIGGFAQAGSNIREIFTGEAAAIKEMTEDAERTTKVIEQQTKLRHEADQQHLSALKEIRALEQEAALVGVRGPGAAIGATRFGAANLGADLPDKLREQERAIREKFDTPEIRQLKEKIILAEKAAGEIEASRGGVAEMGDSVSPEQQAVLDRAKRLRLMLRQNEDEMHREIAQSEKDARGQTRAGEFTAAEKDIDAMNEAARARAEATSTANEHIEAINSQARARQLQTEQKTTEAIQEEFRQRLAAEKEAIEKQTEERLRNLSRQEFKTDADFQRGRLGVIGEGLSAGDAAERLNAAEKQAALESATNAQLDHQLSIGHQFADLRVNSLRAEAEAGRASAKVEADRLQIANEFQTKREQILKVLREDKTLSDSQRRALGQSLGGLGLQEAQATARIEHPVVPGMGTAPNFQTLTGTGLAQFAGASAENEQVAAQQRAAKDLEEAAKDTKKAAADLAAAAAILAAISAF